MTDSPTESPHPRLGRGAVATPRHILARSAPMIARRAAAPPNFLKVPKQISMWGNDVNGDCVTAEEAFAKACHDPEIFISDAEVISWATSHNVLNGAYLYQVLQFMQADGFQQDRHVYDDGPYFTVDWTDRGALTSAIAEGPVKIGIAANQLENAYWQNGGHTGWFATGFLPDSAEDHCVSLCGYGSIGYLAQQLNAQLPPGTDTSKPAYAMFTWNSVGIIDEPSMLAITHEAWLREPTTVIKKKHHRRHHRGEAPTEAVPA